MFEILTTIANLLLEGGTQFRQQREERRRRHFGQSLLQCYFRLLEIVSTGQGIVIDLEYFVERYRGNRQISSAVLARLRMQCHEQSLNLIRLADALDRMSSELVVFAPDTGYKLKSLVDGKQHAIWRLANTFGTGYLYLGAAPDPSHKPSSLDELKEQSIFVEGEWGRSVAAKIDAYLEDRQPRSQLRALRKSAMELRELLVSIASLDDILWTVDNFRTNQQQLFSQEDINRATRFFDKPDKALLPKERLPETKHFVAEDRIVARLVDLVGDRVVKLTLPAHITIGDLIPVLVGRLGHSRSLPYSIFHNESGRKLKPDETLSSAGVKNGHVLQIYLEGELSRELPLIETGARNSEGAPAKDKILVTIVVADSGMTLDARLPSQEPMTRLIPAIVYGRGLPTWPPHILRHQETGRFLKEADTLLSIGVKDGDTLELVLQK